MTTPTPTPAALTQIQNQQFRGSKGTTELVQSMSPHAWGLPDKFSAWRNGQPLIVSASLDSPTRYHVNCAPTGVGKSPAYVAHAVMAGARVVIVTSTLSLQTQNMEDFSSIGMVDVRGRSNYKCLGFTHLNCDEGHPKCHVCKAGNCPRDLALEKARKSDLVITNYPFWMSIHKYGDGLGNVDLLILDEAHDAVDQLASFMSVTLSIDNLARSWRFITHVSHGTDLENVCRDSLTVPDGDDLPTWIEWAQVTLRPYSKFVEACSPSPEGEPPQIGLSAHESVLKDFAITKQVMGALLAIAQCKPDTWIAELTDSGIKFDPIWPAVYNQHLFQDVKKIVLYSATILPKTMGLLGVPKDAYTFSEFDSVFDPNRSPTYYVPTVRMSFRASDSDRQQAVTRIDQIMRARLDRKGIVHTGSFERQKLILDKSEFSRYMFYNSSSMTRAVDGKTISKTIELFRASEPPALLVTPSATTGLDFNGPDCRYVILLKVPFPDTRSKVMQRRKELDPEYYNYVTMLDIIQGFGRGMRSPGDWCENFAIDDNYKWFINANQHHMPQWFKRQALLNNRYVRQIEYLPQPMKLG